RIARGLRAAGSRLNPPIPPRRKRDPGVYSVEWRLAAFVVGDPICLTATIGPRPSKLRSAGANMATDHIRNPIEWGWDDLKRASGAVGSTAHAVSGDEQARVAAPPAVRRISAADLREVLKKGLADFGAYRTDVIFICIIYPVVGLLLAQLAFGNEMLPM